MPRENLHTTILSVIYLSINMPLYLSYGSNLYLITDVSLLFTGHIILINIFRKFSKY